MSKLKSIREQQNITQEELSEKSGISVRTIQRIESGNTPKGYTLKTLSKVLEVEEEQLSDKNLDNNISLTENYARIKLINLSSIPFIILPPLNIIVPLILMFGLKQKSKIVKELISVQIMWTILAPVIFMICIFTKLGNTFTLISAIVIILSNLFIILRNARSLDTKQTLFYRLDFSML